MSDSITLYQLRVIRKDIQTYELDDVLVKEFYDWFQAHRYKRLIKKLDRKTPNSNNTEKGIYYITTTEWSRFL